MRKVRMISLALICSSLASGCANLTPIEQPYSPLNDIPAQYLTPTSFSAQSWLIELYNQLAKPLPTPTIKRCPGAMPYANPCLPPSN